MHAFFHSRVLIFLNSCTANRHSFKEEADNAQSCSSLHRTSKYAIFLLELRLDKKPQNRNFISENIFEYSFIESKNLAFTSDLLSVAGSIPKNKFQ